MNRILTAMLVFGALCVAAPRASAERAAAVDPSNSEAARAWQASYTAEGAGNYEGALKALEQLPAAQKQGYVAYFRRGWLQYCLGRHADAVSAYAAAIKLEPDSVEARVAQR